MSTAELRGRGAIGPDKKVEIQLAGKCARCATTGTLEQHGEEIIQHLNALVEGTLKPKNIDKLCARLNTMTLTELYAIFGSWRSIKPTQVIRLLLDYGLRRDVVPGDLPAAVVNLKALKGYRPIESL